MRPVIVIRKLAVSIALCVVFGMAAKAETISGANTGERQSGFVSHKLSETAGMLLLGTGLVGVATTLRRKLNADKLT